MTSLSTNVSSPPRRSVGLADVLASSWATGTSNTSERSLRSLPKSSPIAIKRDDKLQLPVDSDDDSSAASVAESMDRLTVGSLPSKKRGFSKKKKTLAKSMPAPRLTPQKMETCNFPPMSLPEADAPDSVETNGGGGATYGSLRDSHMKGRFLDGPMSYRDARSGQIHMMGRGITPEQASYSLPHRYHSQQNMPLSSSMADWSRIAPGTMQRPPPRSPENKEMSPGMMPGDRMRQSPRLQAQPSSKLADALEGGKPQKVTPEDDAENTTPPTPEHFALYPTKFTRIPGHRQEQPLSPDEILSTSLTGLELLQKTNGHGLSTPTTAMDFWKTSLEASIPNEDSPMTLLVPQAVGSNSSGSHFEQEDPSSNNHQDSGVCFDLDL